MTTRKAYAVLHQMATLRHATTAELAKAAGIGQNKAGEYIKNMHAVGLIKPEGFGTRLGPTGQLPVNWKWTMDASHRDPAVQLDPRTARCPGNKCPHDRTTCARYMSPIPLKNALIEDYSAVSSLSVCLARISLDSARAMVKNLPKPGPKVHEPFGSAKS